MRPQRSGPFDFLRDITTTGLWRNEDYYYSNEKGLNLLGKGAYGSVYEAKKGGTQVAIKSVYIEYEGEEKNFLRELTILHNANHDNIIKMYNAKYSPERNVLEFATEMCELDLKKLMTQYECQLGVIRKIAADIARGLEYLHFAKIAHRDLKPANIFVNLNPIIKAKIGDFGMARSLGTTADLEGFGGEPAATSTRPRALTDHVVTRWYRAPEVSEGNYSDKIDVWSFGCIYAELLSAHLGEKGDNKEVLFRVGSSEFSPGPRGEADLEKIGEKREFFSPDGTFIGKKLKALINGATEDLNPDFELIQQMLHISPGERISASDSSNAFAELGFPPIGTERTAAAEFRLKVYQCEASMSGRADLKQLLNELVLSIQTKATGG